MAFDISLMVNNSEKNAVTKRVSYIMTVSGTLKQETSIIDPIIIIEADLSSLTGCNYMHIPAFGRYYFVNNIKSVRNGLVEITGHVDVLMTYAAGIKANKAIVRRQAHKWNLYLNDGIFKVYQDPIIKIKEFPSGFTTQEFVLGVAGRAHSTSGGEEET